MASPADHTTYPTWKHKTCCIVSMICGQLWSDRRFFFMLSEKIRRRQIPGGTLGNSNLLFPFKPKSDCRPFQASLFVRSPCLWSPLFCLMGSWPQGKGYSLSFLQLAFTVSLAELMHHIFEAQVPCVPLSDCRRDLTDSLYPFQPALLDDVGKIPWRIPFTRTPLSAN